MITLIRPISVCVFVHLCGPELAKKQEKKSAPDSVASTAFQVDRAAPWLLVIGEYRANKQYSVV